ncbi:hypothetical protein C0966_17550 (plasmid) [Bacillus methanolicus]|uniref:hypothetical protein n=1 Tax=Bacillus methanolicus TaxID=1471 RepID=UPI0023805154|nr:hypothetical protein [Bacillus methanolicus]MDE3841069.1 hypothetical protein [Bacillus methanolicus]
MLKGQFIGPDNLTLLKRGEEYFLFPNGTSHFYVEIKIGKEMVVKPLNKLKKNYNFSKRKNFNLFH